MNLNYLNPIYISKDRLKIKWEIKETPNIKISPLSIQTVVENAVNHDVLKRVVGGTVTIRIYQKSNYTEIPIIGEGLQVFSKPDVGTTIIFTIPTR